VRSKPDSEVVRWGRRSEAVPVRTGTKSTHGPSCYSGDMTATHASPPEPGTRPDYPFAEWLDGRLWTLVRGRDYWGSADTFMDRIRGSANARSIRIVMAVEDAGRFVKVRAIPHD
jgi:hypothetical protein